MNLDFELFPVLTPADNPRVGDKVLRLLASIRDTQAMGKAATINGVSPRHGWTLIRNLERRMGQRLVVGMRGDGSILTPFAVRLLQAERRLREAMEPALVAALAGFSATMGEEDADESGSNATGLPLDADGGQAS